MRIRCSTISVGGLTAVAYTSCRWPLDYQFATDTRTIDAILHLDVVWIESEGIPHGGAFIGHAAVFDGLFAKIAAKWELHRRGRRGPFGRGAPGGHPWPRRRQTRLILLQADEVSFEWK